MENRLMRSRIGLIETSPKFWLQITRYHFLNNQWDTAKFHALYFQGMAMGAVGKLFPCASSVSCACGSNGGNILEYLSGLCHQSVINLQWTCSKSKLVIIIQFFSWLFGIHLFLFNAFPKTFQSSIWISFSFTLDGGSRSGCTQNGTMKRKTNCCRFKFFVKSVNYEKIIIASSKNSTNWHFSISSPLSVKANSHALLGKGE